MAKKPTRKTTTKPAGKPKLAKLDETGRREKPDRRQQEETIGGERRKTARRRQIDPTTCERDYSDAEIEFMHALDAYKRSSGRMFPTCSEILEVLGNLGYQKLEMPAKPCCQNESSEEVKEIDEVEIAG